MIAQTAFRSEETFTQREFRRWLDERSRSDINHYELLNGRIVMTPPATWPHGGIEAILVRFIGEHVERLYEQAIKPLSAADRLRLATLILRGIPPESLVDYSEAWTDQDYRDFTDAGWQRVEAMLGEEDA